MNAFERKIWEKESLIYTLQFGFRPWKKNSRCHVYCKADAGVIWDVADT